MVEDKVKRYQLILGWIAVSIVLVIASLWAYWGGIENFHEGWYSKNIWENLFMMIVQYWSFSLIFILIGLLGIRFRIAALAMCVTVGIAAAIFFGGASFSVLWVMILIPLAGIGLLFFFGRPYPKKIGYILIISIPVIILAITTIIGLARVSKRVDDGDYGMRRVQGKEICLVWAPRGPGWPEEGTDYESAKSLCAHLSEDGTEILDEELGIWRLPSIEEAVALQMHHGKNAGGVWDEGLKKAEYELRPDKETPLWDPHSMIIYYWTADTENIQRAYIITYNGGVFPRNKDSKYGYLSFRAVKDCD